MDVAAVEEVVTTPVVGVTEKSEFKVDTGRPGVKMFMAVPQHSVMTNPLEAESQSFNVYHKQIVGLVTPFDLPIEHFPDYMKMLEADPAAVAQVNVMMRGAVAESTAGSYHSVIRKFRDSCNENGFAYPHFDKPAVLNFVKEQFAAKCGMAFFQKLIPALALLEKVLDRSPSALTEQVRGAVNSVVRELAKSRGIVKKATGYSFNVVKELIAKEILPHITEVSKINVFHFRSIFRAVVIYCTFCRFDDFSRLTTADFSNHGDYIHIVLEHSKNDQFGDNSTSVIPARPDSDFCPVRLIRLYFQCFGLSFGTGKDFVNFRLNKQAGRHVPLTTVSLSRSNATMYTRKLLDRHGYEGQKFTEKSMKVQGVTDLLDTGEPLENVMVSGRWKTQTTPLHYRNLSVNFRLQIAKNIPLGDVQFDQQNSQPVVQTPE